MQELGQVAALLEEVVTILGPIRRDSYEGQTGHKVGIRAAQTKGFEDSRRFHNHGEGPH